MKYLSLDSAHQDESNESQIIKIESLDAEILAILQLLITYIYRYTIYKMSWTCPGHYKVHVPLPALLVGMCDVQLLILRHPPNYPNNFRLIVKHKLVSIQLSK